MIKENASVSNSIVAVDISSVRRAVVINAVIDNFKIEPRDILITPEPMKSGINAVTITWVCDKRVVLLCESR